MKDNPLRILADFLADWSLEAPFWAGLLEQLPRRSLSTGGVYLFRDPDRLSGLAVGPGFTDCTFLQRAATLQRVGLHYLLGSLDAAPTDLYDPSWHLAVEWRMYQFLPEDIRTVDADLAAMLPRLSDPFPLDLGFYRGAVRLTDTGRWPSNLVSLIMEEHRYWTHGQEFLAKKSEGKSLYWGDQRASFLAQAIRYGTGTPALERWLDWQQLQKQRPVPTDPLRVMLDRYAGTRLHISSRRPSKRYGTFPGVKTVPHLHLVAIIDTSGSISEADLAHFFAQVEYLWRQGHRITLLEADVRVQKVYPFRGTPPQWRPKGGGGTDFDPAIERAELDYHPDLILYFTDGQGPAPRKWAGTPLIWYLTGEGDGAHLPGEKLCLGNHLSHS